MARVIAGGEQARRFMMHGSRSRRDENFFRGEVERFSERVRNTSTKLLNRVRDYYQELTNSPILRRLRNTLITSDEADRYDFVSPIDNITDARKVNPFNARFIMANPLARQMCRDGQCEGYSDFYVDRYPNLRTEDHPDYQAVMSGVWESTNGGTRWTNYWREKPKEDRDLSIIEIHNAQITWAFLEKALKDAQEDPTSTNEAML